VLLFRIWLLNSVNNPIQSRLDEFREQPRIRAGSLILTVFGDSILPRGGRVWLGSLIRLLGPLGLNERLVRTSVFRLTKDGWLRAETMGRRAEYVLTAQGRRLIEEASRHVYASYAPMWDRRWRLIMIVGDLDLALREKVRKSLSWQGFGLIGSDCFVHPSAELTAVQDSLISEGLSPALGALLPMFAADARLAQSASDVELVRRAWDMSTMAVAYEEFIAVYQPIVDYPVDMSDQDAFLLKTLLIHDYRHLLLRDPELPDVLLPTDWPAQQVRLLCKSLYKRLEPSANRHLDVSLCLADGSTMDLDRSLAKRFPQNDPLIVEPF
jgi:phenylacetic acid degradation operon negative regulatory protein